MYQDEKNEYGCPLHQQTGPIAVRNFDVIVDRLSPELRAAFEAERAAQWAELERLLVTGAAPNGTSTANLAYCVDQAPESFMQRRWIKRNTIRISVKATLPEDCGERFRRNRQPSGRVNGRYLKSIGIKRLLRRIGQFAIHELIGNLLPQLAAHHYYQAWSRATANVAPRLRALHSRSVYIFLRFRLSSTLPICPWHR